MVMSGWLVERTREKDKWRYATMEYGGQYVQTMAGMKWVLISSANGWVSPIPELCQPMTAVLDLVMV
jgi:hypothetical protein